MSINLIIKTNNEVSKIDFNYLISTFIFFERILQLIKLFERLFIIEIIIINFELKLTY